MRTIFYLICGELKEDAKLPLLHTSFLSSLGIHNEKDERRFYLPSLGWQLSVLKFALCPICVALLCVCTEVREEELFVERFFPVSFCCGFWE